MNSLDDATIENQDVQQGIPAQRPTNVPLQMELVNELTCRAGDRIGCGVILDVQAYGTH